MYAYLRIAALSAVAAVGLSACATPYGYGPYGGVSVGVGNGYYGSSYGYGSNYGYGYGYPAGYGYSRYGYAPYWGWHNNYYYPGTGYYVYDSYRRPHRWTDAQRRYWSDRRQRARTSSTASQPVVIRDNWNDFSRQRDFRRDRPVVSKNRVQRSVERPARAERVNRSVQVERSRPVRVERTRTERQESASARAERRNERASRSNGRRTNLDD